jgi:hypothetical protein
MINMKSTFETDSRREGKRCKGIVAILQRAPDERRTDIQPGMIQVGAFQITAM